MNVCVLFAIVHVNLLLFVLFGGSTTMLVVLGAILARHAELHYMDIERVVEHTCF